MAKDSSISVMAPLRCGNDGAAWNRRAPPGCAISPIGLDGAMLCLGEAAKSPHSGPEAAMPGVQARDSEELLKEGQHASRESTAPGKARGDVAPVPLAARGLACRIAPLDRS